MGRRVSFELADIIGLEHVRVETYSEVLDADEQFERKTTPQARVFFLVSDDTEPCFEFDVSVFNHRIQLEMDFNTYSDAYAAKTEFLNLLGVPYRVY